MCVWGFPQGVATCPSARIAAIKHRQDDIDGKVTELLAKSTATTDALMELKSMLNRYIVKGKHSKDASPSDSKSVLDNQAALASRTIQQGDKVQVEMSPTILDSGKKHSPLVQDVEPEGGGWTFIAGEGRQFPSSSGASNHTFGRLCTGGKSKRESSSAERTTSTDA
jgi:hypothetical protein